MVELHAGCTRGNLSWKVARTDAVLVQTYASFAKPILSTDIHSLEAQAVRFPLVSTQLSLIFA